MKLNLTWGEYKVEGWHNVDIRAEAKSSFADMAHVVSMMPESIDEVYVEYVYDYLWRGAVITSLVNLKDILKPGGALVVAGIDLDKVNELAPAEQWERLHSVGISGMPGDELRGRDRCAADCMIPLIGAVFPRPVELKLERVAADFPLSSQVPWQYVVMTRKPM